MTNFEKCRQEFTITDTLEDVEGEEYIDFCTTIRRVRGRKVCKASCAECYEWLGQEYKPSILDKAEKRYLSNIVRPFRDKVAGIEKRKRMFDTAKWQFVSDGTENIFIILKRAENIVLPYFEENEMYKGMELNKKYTLEELGI